MIRVYTFEPFIGEDGKHWWRCLHWNGHEIDRSSEGYSRYKDMIVSLRNKNRAIQKGHVVYKIPKRRRGGRIN